MYICSEKGFNKKTLTVRIFLKKKRHCGQKSYRISEGGNLLLKELRAIFASGIYY